MESFPPYVKELNYVRVSESSGCCYKLPQTGSLHGRHFFLMVLEAGKSVRQVPVWLGPGKRPPPGLQVAPFLLCSPLVGNREKAPFVSRK